MKKIIIAMILVLVLMSTATAELYPETARIVELDHEEDMVIVETFNGFLFAFYGCEDYALGDCVSLIMEDNGTELVYDDEIVKAEYSAWTLFNWLTGE